MTKRDHVVQLIDGVWYRLAHGKPPYEHQCCRCGLRHEVAFKFENGNVWERWTILPDETPPPKRRRKGK